MTKTIPLTKGELAVVDDEDFEYLTQWKWCASSDPYAVRAYRHGGSQTVVRMHRLIAERMGLDMSGSIDHVNLDKLDNRRSNLRSASHKDNMRNRRKNRNNTSGLKGVSWCKHRQKWEAYIGVDYRQIHLGRFSTRQEAAAAYASAAKLYFGEFVRLEETHGEPQ